MYYSIFQRNGDWRQFYKTAPVTSVIFIVNTIMFLIVLLFGGFSVLNLYNWGGIVPFAVLENNEWWRIFSAGFLHSGFLHYAVNMVIGVLTLSYALEKIIGSKKFSIIYFLSLILSGITVVYFSGDTTVTIGASGAIFGVLASLLYITIYRKDLVTLRDAQTIRSLSFLNIAFTLIPVIGIFGSNSSVSISGHIGGFIAGFLISFVVIRRNVFKVLH